MPATLEQPETAVETAAPQVLDVSLFDKEQRAVQYLQYAGLLAGDDTVTKLNVLKRVNHAVFADEDRGKIPQMQAEFRKLLEREPDVAKLTEGGAESPVFKLVDGYLAERAAHYKRIADELTGLPANLDEGAFASALHSAQAKQQKYEQERAYYQGSPDLINNAVREHPEALSAGKYLPLGRLALESGMVAGERAKAADMIDDALANAAAHSFLHMAKDVIKTSDADLANYLRFADKFAGNIMAETGEVAISNTPIEKSQAFADATPELARIQALKSLLSAQLHDMTKHTRGADGTSNPPAEQLAEALVRVKPLVRRYQSAAMSLAYHFLGEGAGKDDARMQKLREHLAAMMDKSSIPLQMQRVEAEQSATQLAQETAAYLRSQSVGKPETLAKIDSLLAQVYPKAGQGMAQKFAPAPSYTELAARPVAGAGLGV